MIYEAAKTLSVTVSIDAIRTRTAGFYLLLVVGCHCEPSRYAQDKLREAIPDYCHRDCHDQ